MGVALVGTFFGPPTHSATAHGPSTSVAAISTPSEELLRHAQFYAKDYNVTEVEALRRLGLMTAAEQYMTSMERTHPDRFAGAWIENTADTFAVHVRFTAGPEVLDPHTALVAVGLPIEATYTAETTLAKRIDLTNTANGEWIKALPEMVGLYPDVKSDDIVVVLSNGSRMTSAETEERLGLSNVRVEYAEGTVGDSNKGGLRMTSCTTGFTVINSSTLNKSVATAAHCADSFQQYTKWEPSDGVYHTMNFRGQVRDANADIAWYGTPAHEVRPRFYGAIRGGEGTEQTSWGAAGVGSHLCHQGKTTDYSCGDVTSVSYQPTYAGACPSTCNSSFVRVFGSNLKNLPGDSGGPWYRDSTIYGVHKGGQYNGSIPGQVAYYSKYLYLPTQQSLLTN
ncbi:S1 family peptidase [uncultured Nocardioides sp.]|uniref:S1 family peptidase n=1 Tax=uncultured Nocardioides sp. TaxID=198441 RepID=UPI0026272070|nr:S1 family peptidase [uncultured Nocardioides sp.]